MDTASLIWPHKADTTPRFTKLFLQSCLIVIYREVLAENREDAESFVSGACFLDSSELLLVYRVCQQDHTCIVMRGCLTDVPLSHRWCLTDCTSKDLSSQRCLLVCKFRNVSSYIFVALLSSWFELISRSLPLSHLFKNVRQFEFTVWFCYFRHSKFFKLHNYKKTKHCYDAERNG